MPFGPKSKKRKAFKMRAAVRLSQAAGFAGPRDLMTQAEANGVAEVHLPAAFACIDAGL